MGGDRRADTIEQENETSMAPYTHPQPRLRIFLVDVYAAAGARGLPASPGFAGAGLNEMSEKNFDHFLILILVLIGTVATCYFYFATR